MRKNGFSKIWFFGILIIGGSLACDSVLAGGLTKVNNPLSGSVAERTLTNSPVLQDPAEKSPAAAYLGDAFVQSGYYLIAVSVADPAAPAYFTTPEPGYKLITVEVILGNISGEMLSSNPLNASLEDAEGIVYPARLVGIEGQLPSADLLPGERIGGAVGFIIPENARPATLAYEVMSMVGVYLTASLAPAPLNWDPVTVSILPAIPESGRGDVVEQYGYSMAVTQVLDPATPANYLKIKDGYRMAAIEVLLANVDQSEELRVSSGLATLVDSAGFVHLEEGDGRDGRMEPAKLKIGETVKGWICFILPETATPLYVKYQTDLFDGNYIIAGVG
ncbi:MAG: DUF4352 domain-containing protein [Anaerolineales bacterium]|nr:DUF4352 domain-containing protein [Anaerolineales bacterium]